jgi:hypothetical protein
MSKVTADDKNLIWATKSLADSAVCDGVPLDFSELSLAIVDAIGALSAGMIPPEVARDLLNERPPLAMLLVKWEEKNVALLAFCGMYSGEVACRNLGALWTRKGLFSSELGIEIGSTREFIPVAKLVGTGRFSEKYRQIKAQTLKIPLAQTELSSATPTS